MELDVGKVNENVMLIRFDQLDLMSSDRFPGDKKLVAVQPRGVGCLLPKARGLACRRAHDGLIDHLLASASLQLGHDNRRKEALEPEMDDVVQEEDL